MSNICQGQWFTGHTRMETFQVHWQTTEEVYSHGKPSLGHAVLLQNLKVAIKLLEIMPRPHA
jgi:hypothetical protein